MYDSATQRHTETWTGTSYADAVTDIVYGYNPMGELSSVTVLKENGQTPAAVQSSTIYNAAGGTSTTNLPNTVYNYDLGGRLESTFDSAAGITTSYAYKPNTNYISTETVTRNLSPVTFVYDSQNRLVKQNAGQSNEVDITYNGQGNKVAETVNGITTKYLIDSNNPTGYSQIVEEIVNGLVTRRYTLGHWIISEMQNISGNWTTSYYGYDGHNSVRFLTNASGVVTDNYTFDAFGIKIAGSGTTPNQILYSGEYLDPGTGNYDLRAREYDQNTGTFLTRDTYADQNGDPITLHQYLYAGTDPVMNVDPSGNFSIASVTISIGIMSTLGGVVGGSISAVTGGNFWEGFWKGFISTGVSTTLFTLTPMKNLYLDGVVGTMVANLVVDYFDGKLEAEPQLAAAEIGTSVLLSLVGGAIYSQALPELSTNLANIAVVVENNFPSGSFSTLAEELGPAAVRYSFLGGISVIPSQLVDAAYHAYEWFVQQSQQRQQEIDQAIKNAGG